MGFAGSAVLENNHDIQERLFSQSHLTHSHSAHRNHLQCSHGFHMALNVLAFKIPQLLRDVPILQTGVKFLCNSLTPRCSQEWQPLARVFNACHKVFQKYISTCYHMLFHITQALQRTFADCRYIQYNVGRFWQIKLFFCLFWSFSTNFVVKVIQVQ